MKISEKLSDPTYYSVNPRQSYTTKQLKMKLAELCVDATELYESVKTKVEPENTIAELEAIASISKGKMLSEVRVRHWMGIFVPKMKKWMSVANER
jgi:hypothetical protein